MRDFIQLMTALAALAIVQYLALALGVTLLVLLLMAAIVHPRRTLRLLAAVGLLALAFKAPTPSAAVICSAAVALTVRAIMTRRRPTTVAQPALLLKDQRSIKSFH